MSEADEERFRDAVLKVDEGFNFHVAVGVYRQLERDPGWRPWGEPATEKKLRTAVAWVARLVLRRLREEGPPVSCSFGGLRMTVEESGRVHLFLVVVSAEEDAPAP